MPSSSRSGIAPGKTTQPIGPRLRTMVAAVSARILRSDGERVVAAAGDPHLLLGADDQVAVGEHGLELLRDAVRFDVALLAGGVAGEAPEVRPVVDVEDHLAAGGAGDPHGLPLRRIGVRREKCVPVTRTALAEATNAASMSASVSAMSAQFSR